MHSTILKCEFLLLSAEQQIVKTSFGITIYFLKCNNGDYKFCFIKKRNPSLNRQLYANGSFLLNVF